MVPTEKGERALPDIEGIDKVAWLMGMATIYRSIARTTTMHQSTKYQSAKYNEYAKDFENQSLRLLKELTSA